MLRAILSFAGILLVLLVQEADSVKAIATNDDIYSSVYYSSESTGRDDYAGNFPHSEHYHRDDFSHSKYYPYGQNQLKHHLWRGHSEQWKLLQRASIQLKLILLNLAQNSLQKGDIEDIIDTRRILESFQNYIKSTRKRTHNFHYSLWPNISNLWKALFGSQKHYHHSYHRPTGTYHVHHHVKRH